MKEKINNALNGIDERFVEEAAEYRRKAHGAKALKIALIPAGAAAAAAIVLGIGAANGGSGGVDLTQPPVTETAAVSASELARDITAEAAQESAVRCSDPEVFSCGKHTHTPLSDGVSTITAKAGGIVTFEGTLPCGNSLIILEEDGTQTLYCHLGAFAVDVGESVEKGAVIADAGSADDSGELVEAFTDAGVDIRRTILTDLGTAQDEMIRSILSENGVLDEYSKTGAADIKNHRGTTEPLHVESLQDRNTSGGWQEGTYYGADLCCEEMENGETVWVHSYAAGKVIAAQDGWNNGLGSFVVIDHGYGLASVYAHLSDIDVEVGQTVECDDCIALTGNTGFTGSRCGLLHMEIRENGEPQDVLLELYQNSDTSGSDDDKVFAMDSFNNIVLDCCENASEYDSEKAQQLLSEGTAPLAGTIACTTENGCGEMTESGHSGVDITSSESTDVGAYLKGTVLAADDSLGAGKYVIIDHGSGVVTVYAQLSDSYVNVGQQVEQGEIIGKYGVPEYAYSTGPHLHFEIRTDGATSSALYNIIFKTEATVSSGDFIWPVGGDGGLISEMMDGYGGYSGHTGIDIAADDGTEVYASAGGSVILAEYYYGYGNCVMIRHSNGLVTVYAHLSEIAVESGTAVLSGDVIGKVGTTGDSEVSASLHFEVRDGDYYLNPVDCLPYHERAAWCVEEDIDSVNDPAIIVTAEVTNIN